MPVALITGGSRGLGRALARGLHDRGWDLVVDARDRTALATAVADLPNAEPVPGDVTDPGHRDALAAAVARYGRLDLLVNNASALGSSPLPPLHDLAPEELRHLHDVNVVAPLALLQAVLPWLAKTASAEAGGTVVDISSDAAVEAYPGWGGYGSTKAALDQLTRVLAAERPDLRVYAFDPGDMRTDMQQAASPGEDISDRPEPETVVPALLRLVDERPPSGRYRAAELAS